MRIAPPNDRERLRSAFTLIELLVVMAIIALLASVALPMVPAVNDRARIGACEARLQQIGVALRLYAEDHGRYPASLRELYARRYLEQEEVLRCDKLGAEYFYHPPGPSARGETVVAACCDPATPRGRRPHRQRTVLVRLHVHGGTSLQR